MDALKIGSQNLEGLTIIITALKNFIAFRDDQLSSQLARMGIPQKDQNETQARLQSASYDIAKEILLYRDGQNCEDTFGKTRFIFPMGFGFAVYTLKKEFDKKIEQSKNEYDRSISKDETREIFGLVNATKNMPLNSRGIGGTYIDRDAYHVRTAAQAVNSGIFGRDSSARTKILINAEEIRLAIEKLQIFAGFIAPPEIKPLEEPFAEMSLG